MLKITAQRAAAMEVHGGGKFEIKGRFIYFTSNDGRRAIWEASTKASAEMQLASWRRVFTRELVA